MIKPIMERPAVTKKSILNCRSSCWALFRFLRFLAILTPLKQEFAWSDGTRQKEPTCNEVFAGRLIGVIFEIYNNMVQCQVLEKDRERGSGAVAFQRDLSSSTSRFLDCRMLCFNCSTSLARDSFAAVTALF